ncbi:MAG: DUF3048 domain-containing protein [Candidatus Spechtbacteria bacterium]|nr:DUF3048 domain-containing protein [Candidatus Spechtbacteria bacterium]
MRHTYPSFLFGIFLGFLAAGAFGLFFYLVGIGGKSVLIRKDIARNVSSSSSTTLRGSEVGEASSSVRQTNSLTGILCEHFSRRPFAVMIAEDREARPLSGIGMADLVIEMPVVTGSITRMMAIFVCEDPKEIGSVRSARHDFIPLAQGYDAIFAHWGGSARSLEELGKGVIDNLDALPNKFEAFYRKDGVPAPHDGFTSMARLENAARSLGYRMDSKFEGYNFLSSPPRGILLSGKKISIEYRNPYAVFYEYNAQTNAYLRSRGGAKEIDLLMDRQVEAKNVVIMRAKSRQIGGGYNDVDILGGGEAVVYRNGEEIKGTWVKKESRDALRFFNGAGEEISFVPGKIWIEVVEPATNVNYTL